MKLSESMPAITDLWFSGGEPTLRKDLAEIIDLFGKLNRDGTTIVVVTHDEELANAASRKIHMRDGVIVDQ